MTDMPERICPDCGSRHYARCYELREDGKHHPGSILRCIECKTTYLDPALAKSPHVEALVKAAVEAERAKYALLLAKADMALDGTVQNMAGTSVYGFQGSYFTLPALKAEIAAIRAEVQT